MDCYQSLQTTAGMKVENLRKLFGDKLSFWGGVSVEKLVGGEPGDIREEVTIILQNDSYRNGGFILGPSQSIAMGTRYENFMTMLETYVNNREK